jgi:hypothetical protein
VRALLLAGVIGAALSAPILVPAMAQTVQTDPQGFSPFNTHGSLDENINTSTIRNAPALGLSSIYGLNPCSLGASAGITTPLFGIAGAISTTDKDCETRNTAALAITGLKDEAAGREVMCIIKEFREAVARLGKPCIGDQPQRVAMQQQAPAQLTAQVVPTPIVPAVVTRPTVAPDAPAFCKVDGLMLNAYPECIQGKPEPHAKRNASSVASVPQHNTTIERAAVTPERATVTPQAPVPVTIRPSVPAGSAKVPATDMVGKLMERGAAMMALGDVSAARLLYKRAAEAGDARAAVEIGRTYDPQYLAKTNLADVKPDPTLANDWYRRALALGDTKAGLLLTSR